MIESSGKGRSTFRSGPRGDSVRNYQGLKQSWAYGRIPGYARLADYYEGKRVKTFKHPFVLAYITGMSVISIILQLNHKGIL